MQAIRLNFRTISTGRVNPAGNLLAAGTGFADIHFDTVANTLHAGCMSLAAV